MSFRHRAHGRDELERGSRLGGEPRETVARLCPQGCHWPLQILILKAIHSSSISLTCPSFPLHVECLILDPGPLGPLQPVILGTNYTHKWAGTSPSILWALALPARKLSSLGTNLSHQWVKTSLRITTVLQSDMTGPSSHTSRPTSTLGPAEAQPHPPRASTSSRTPQVPQSAVSGTSSTQQQSDISSGTPGHCSQTP